MNDIAKNWPVLSLEEAHARLTAAGSRFETVDAVIRGVPMKVWKNVPAAAREVFTQARAYGGREFLIHENERVSYDGFARAAARLAAHLHEQGLMKGDRVALVMRNLPEWPVVFLA
ncbi:MAG: AMP-binding protein, partial [Pseudomonadota bacterium]